MPNADSKALTRSCTLHFNLHHCPANASLVLHAMGNEYVLQPHTDETLLKHRKKNPALGLVPKSHLSHITHFVEEVGFSEDVVSIYYATLPARNSDSVMREMVLSAMHVPARSRRIAAQRRMRENDIVDVPTTLKSLGVTKKLLTQANASFTDILQGAAEILDPVDTAKSILFQHPEIASINPEIAADMLDKYIDEALDNHPELYLYISEHPPGSKDPWQAGGVAMNPDGTPFEAPDDVLDKNGEPIPWPVDKTGKRRIPQSNLSDGVLTAAKAAMEHVLRETKNAAKFHGVVWKRNLGIPATHDKQGVSVTGRAAANETYKWTLANPGSSFGLDVEDAITFNPQSREIGVRIANTANRCLGAYVQFENSKREPITPKNWQDRIKDSGLTKGLQPDPTKRYVSFLRPASTILGIPLPASPVEVSFPFPDEAVRANILLGGLGNGGTDHDVSQLGIISTCILNYGIPGFMISCGVGLDGTEWYFGLITNPTILELLLGVCMNDFGEIWRPTLSWQTLLTRAASGVAMIIFTKALIVPIARRIAARILGQQAAQAAPVVGWVMKAMCILAATGNVISTSVAIDKSPGTYALNLSRAIDVKVTVIPDPVHGGVWPESFDTFKLKLSHDSGSENKIGPLPKPNGRSAPIEQLFVNVPAGRGDRIQVTAELFSANGWLCGSWASDWVPAATTGSSTTLEIKGSIIERLVPLDENTTYHHKRKLAYDSAKSKHFWKETADAPKDVEKSGGVVDAQHKVTKWVNVTSNNQAFRIGYTWMASGQGLPLDHGTEPLNSEMYAFQSISVGDDPEQGIKEPTRGFSLQPYLAFDQFGPLPLLSLPLTFQSALDGASEDIPSNIRKLFEDAQHPLPARTSKKIVTKSVEWWIGEAGKSTYLFVLKRQPSTIVVHPYPMQAFSTRNFFLDPRADAQGRQHLRHVALEDPSRTFDYASDNSWGVFMQRNLSAVVIHPRGYALGVSFQNHQMEVLTLPQAGMRQTGTVPVALAVSGKGKMEGLVNAPRAMTVTADGRVLVLEQGNARIQAFDAMGNPTQCFSGTLTFSLDGKFAATLDQRTISSELAEELQRKTKPDLAPLQFLEQDHKSDLDAGRITDEIRGLFTQKGITLPDQVRLKKIQAGKIWLLQDDGAHVEYDIRDNNYELPVRRGASYTVEVQNKGTQWLLRDMVNVQSFLVRKNATTGKLDCKQLIAVMALKEPASANIEYLDVACEPDGFVYVLSYVRPGARPSDYRLDIYNPDGTFLARTPKAGSSGSGVNGARITVDHWRTLYTLNYEAFLGPGNRTEPSISMWAPSVPAPKSQPKKTSLASKRGAGLGKKASSRVKTRRKVKAKSKTGRSPARKTQGKTTRKGSARKRS